MLITYVVVALTYVFAACSGAVLILFVNHLDPKEQPRAETYVEAPELKLAS